METRRLLLGLVIAVSTLAGAACKKEESGPKPTLQTQPGAPPKAAAAPLAYAPRVEVAVTEDGFVPNKIPAKAGEQLTLVITRKTDKTCATEILFHGQEGKTALPVDKAVEVNYTPKQSGIVRFGCAMGMMVGGVLEVAP
jgi:plastocyanin domain-containing protein